MTYVKSLCCTPQTCTILCVNYVTVKLETTSAAIAHKVIPKTKDKKRFLEIFPLYPTEGLSLKINLKVSRSMQSRFCLNLFNSSQQIITLVSTLWQVQFEVQEDIYIFISIRFTSLQKIHSIVERQIYK